MFIFAHEIIKFLISMKTDCHNKIRVVLADKQITNHWLACSNVGQYVLDHFIESIK